MIVYIVKFKYHGVQYFNAYPNRLETSVQMRWLKSKESDHNGVRQIELDKEIHCENISTPEDLVMLLNHLGPKFNFNLFTHM